MAKQISFKDLCDLVANIDYLSKDSYPVKFGVKGTGKTKMYECGITGTFKYDGNAFDEYQYLSQDLKGSLILDLTDADDMSYDHIAEMLKKKCSITDESIITLYDSQSFNGRKKRVSDTDVTGEFIEMVTQCDLTDEVKKGIDWLKEILEEDVVLISTYNFGEHINLQVKDLNGMSGHEFAFLFNRKVLYYDVCFNVLSTYAPCTGKELRDFYKRIECNDNFKWVMLKVCTGEDLLSCTRPCNIEIRDPQKGVRYIDWINSDKLADTLSKACEYARSMQW